MPSSRRVPLNPCDYLLYTDHVIRMRRRQGPNIAYMALDIDGEPDPDAMRASIAKAMALSPTTLGRLRVNFRGGWLQWSIPANPEEAAKNAINDAYRFIDLRDGAPDLDQPHATTGENPVDFRNGPQICMTHYALPDRKSRICIRWPHWLMDAAGTMGFLGLWKSCYDEVVGGDSAKSVDVTPDVRQWCPLKGTSLARRLKIIRSQPKAADAAKLRVGIPNDVEDGEVVEHRVIHRCWDEHAMETIRNAAKHGVPAGPARFTRYLAVRVLRALDRLFEENNWQGQSYRITLPMRVRGPENEDPSPALLFGNYLVSPLLVFDRETAHDATHLGEELTRQLQEYTDAHGDVAQWALMALAGLLPFFAHRWIFGLRMFTAHFSSGFSFYGELKPPLRTLGDMPITNFWGGGPTTIPPGMNPVFSRFDKSLNLALTYSWPVISDETAQRYVDLIEEELLTHPA